MCVCVAMSRQPRWQVPSETALHLYYYVCSPTIFHSSSASLFLSPPLLSFSLSSPSPPLLPLLPLSYLSTLPFSLLLSLLWLVYYRSSPSPVSIIIYIYICIWDQQRASRYELYLYFTTLLLLFLILFFFLFPPSPPPLHSDLHLLSYFMPPL